jgi:hypothetical protein
MSLVKMKRSSKSSVNASFKSIFSLSIMLHVEIITALFSSWVSRLPPGCRDVPTKLEMEIKA